MILKKMWNNIHQAIIAGAERSKYQYFIFGLFGFISYPLYYLLWFFSEPDIYENLTLRLVASALCIPLIFHRYVSDGFQRWLPIYWYLTLMYCLPFFFTFMVLKNDLSTIWLLNAMSGLVWGVLLLDSSSLIGIMLIGVPLGYFFYRVTTVESLLLPYHYFDTVFLFFSVIIFSALFSAKKDKFQEEKLQIMKLMGASVAHELRTPLSSLRYGVESLYRYFPILVKAYRKADSAALLVEEEELKDSTVLLLEKLPNSMERELKLSSMVIELLLNNISVGINAKSKECFLITSCIEETLENYPFKEGERTLIEWEPKTDFKVYGENLSFVLVFINLIKNSLYYIAKVNKGMIRIRVENEDNKHHFVYFIDTATGISEKELPHIFDRFYSNRLHGTGAGLAYCKMVMKSIGGDILCSSKENEYTEFKLVFPVT